MPPITTRDEAFALLCEWVTSESLRRHCLAVEASMLHYARKGGHDEAKWAIAGLLHDADYERYPDLDDSEHGHPRTIVALLTGNGTDREIVDAIAGHAPFLGVPRDTEMARTLFAVDELSGFVVACCAVRPGGIDGLTAKSVRKKLKSPAFAAAVSRDDIALGAEELGVDLNEHITEVIAALDARGDELGLHLAGPEG